MTALRLKRLIAICLFSVSPLFLVHATANEAWNWQWYQNDVTGLKIQYPATLLAMMPQADSKISRGFQSNDQRAQLIEFSNVNLFDNAEDYLHHLLAEPEYQSVTYKSSGDGWFVLSGYRGTKIFYEKYTFSGDQTLVQGFVLEYDITKKKIYNAVAARISKTFKYIEGS